LDVCSKYKREHLNKCIEKAICDNICLKPPHNAHKVCPENVNVSHHFKVKLGEYKVTKDVKVIHTITANLNHHITENVICNHASCNKHTHETTYKKTDGKHCNVSFPKKCDKIVHENVSFCREKPVCKKRQRSTKH
jgi:hypothetical protein